MAAPHYQAPLIVDFGSIAAHTFQTPGTIKGGGVIWHCDMWNEQSSGSDADWFPKDTCVGRT